MPLPEVKVTVSDVRRFWLRAQLLDTPVSDVGAALAHHGYIQIDPLNVCGRMHDLILRNRVAGYREGDLMRFLHGEENLPHAPSARVGFEHHIPGKNILVAFASDAWPHLLSEMQARARRTGAWSGKLTAREKEFAPALLAELAARGPLSSEDLHDGRRSYRGWGASTLAKTTLQKLFFHGRVLIAARKSQRRYYSLPESVLPSAVLAQPLPSTQETARWLILLKLRQHRLVKLSKADLAKVEDRVASVVVTNVGSSSSTKDTGGTSRTNTVSTSSLKLFCLREDLPLFGVGAALVAGPENITKTKATESASRPSRTLASSQLLGRPLGQPLGRLLAPLDPLIYNRPLTAALWDFNYTWEVYTPAHKRVRGYYALPLLAGTELVGHVDPKVDREAGKLLIQNREVRRGYTDHANAAVKDLAKFLSVR